MDSEKRRPRGLALTIASSIAAAAFVVIPAACTAVVDLDGLSGGQKAGGPVGDGCIHDRWPAPPTSAKEGGSEDFFVVVRAVELGEAKKTPEGFDLDSMCTCNPGGPSCAYPAYAIEDHCDGVNGRDNAVAKVFKVLEDAVGMDQVGSSAFSARAETGQWSVIFHIWDYNGEPNDAQVSVSLHESYWDEAGKTKQPTWDGTDLWPVASTSLTDEVSIDKPRYVDKVAYVTNGVVVASLPESYLSVGEGGAALGLRLTGGTVIGTLEKKNDKWRISEGTIGARWKADDIFKVLGTFSLGGQALCNDGGAAYTRFKEVVCGYIDISSTLGGSTTPCDALSFGMKFSTESAGVDKVYVPEPQMTTCTKSSDPANDTCDTL